MASTSQSPSPILRQDGVYIQFVTAPIKPKYSAPTSGCGYNVIRILNNGQLLKWGSMNGLLYDHHPHALKGYLRRPHHEPWDPTPNIEALQALCKAMNLTQLSDPAQTAFAIYNMDIDFLDGKINNDELRIKYKYCVNGSDADIEATTLTDNDSTAGVADDEPEGLWSDPTVDLTVDTDGLRFYLQGGELLYDSARPPYVFYPLPVLFDTDPYYAEWVRSQTRNGCEEFNKVVAAMINPMQMPELMNPASLDPHAHEREIIVGPRGCDVCNQADDKCWEQGIYTFGPQVDDLDEAIASCIDTLDICVPCSLTPEGQELLQKHTFTFHRWSSLHYAESLTICSDLLDAAHVYGQVSPDDGTFSGLVAIKFRDESDADDAGDWMIRGVYRNQYHGDCLIKIGNYYPEYRWSLLLNGHTMQVEEHQSKQYRQLWKDGWLGGNHPECLLPDALFNLKQFPTLDQMPGKCYMCGK